MKNYLSFGGGVNSVALHLLLLDQGAEFESVFVNHGTDWPETYQYVAGFQWWLKANGHRPITILRPNVQGHTILFEYYAARNKIPSIMKRDCTDKFKLRPIYSYVNKPCFMMLGIDSGESHRAVLNSKKQVENRFPLIEADINRNGCVKIIASHGLPIPQKSGCFICMFQKISQWKQLRMTHPDLFCKAEILERNVMAARVLEGKAPFTICNNKKTLRSMVDEKQSKLWQEDEYPPCHCML